MRRTVLLAALLTFFVGCAGLSVSPGDSGKGIRYYQSAPYLLVYTDNTGGLKTELIFLPDRSRIMSAYPYGIFANNNTTLDFQNGVLTGSESEPDATVIPQAVIGALEKVATASIAAALLEPSAGKPHAVPAPRLFKIEWDADTKQAYLVGRDGRIGEGSRTDVNVKGAPEKVEKEEGEDEKKKQQAQPGVQNANPPAPAPTPPPPPARRKPKGGVR